MLVEPSDAATGELCAGLVTRRVPYRILGVSTLNPEHSFYVLRARAFVPCSPKLLTSFQHWSQNFDLIAKYAAFLAKANCGLYPVANLKVENYV